MKEMVLTLISTAAAATIFGMIIPDGAMKKYVSFVVSLAITLALLSPVMKVVGQICENRLDILGFTDEISLPSGITTNADSLISLSIVRALCEKFSLDSDDLSVRCVDGNIVINVEKRFGLIASDLEDYTLRKFGLKAEVFYNE